MLFARLSSLSSILHTILSIHLRNSLSSLFTAGSGQGRGAAATAINSMLQQARKPGNSARLAQALPGK